MENKDQIALRRWIHAGLAIPEVRALHGDAKYIFSNMIAKYSLAASAYALSLKAEAMLEARLDLNAAHKRSRLYGKHRPTIFEHAIPASIVRTQLLTTEGTDSDVLEVLTATGPVVVITREEDSILNSHGLRSRMPDGWEWNGDALARYHSAGIALSRRQLRVTGKLKR